MSKVAEFVKSAFEQTCRSNTFGKCLKNVKLISVENGKCKAELKVREEHTNLFGTLHGGFISTLVDCISTYALMSSKENTPPGVSVNLQVTFMKTAYPGDTISISANTVKAGRSLAFLEVEILNKENGKVIANGYQTKYIAES